METLKEILTDNEREELAVCESEVKSGLLTFWEVGNALLQIKTKRLYREDHPDFETYCREKWRFSRQHAHRLIAAADVFENVPEIGSERQARAIARFEKDLQAAVWQIAEKTAPVINGKPKVSAGHLQAVAEVVSGILLAGGLDDGSGEIKPIGTLLDANVTEHVYERMMRQKEVVRQKLSENGKNAISSPSSASSNESQPELPSGQELPAQPKAALQPATSEMKARLLLRVLQTWVDGEDKERQDRNTALHPAKYAVYHFTKTLLGVEKHEETEMRAHGSKTLGECDYCSTQDTQVQDYVFTNTSTQRLSSARLALCEGCVEHFTTLAETAKGVSV